MEGNYHKMEWYVTISQQLLCLCAAAAEQFWKWMGQSWTIVSWFGGGGGGSNTFFFWVPNFFLNIYITDLCGDKQKKSNGKSVWAHTV